MGISIDTHGEEHDRLPGGESSLTHAPPRTEQRSLGRFLFQAIALAGIMLASLGGYLTVLYLRGPAASLETYLPWDEWIPFHHAWVWVYLLPYLIGPVVIGLMTRDTFRWYVSRGLATVGLTLLIFVVFPTKTKDREVRPLSDDVTGWMYQQMILIDDPPANAAPSLHVSLTCLLALALFRDFPRWWAVTLLGVISVWIATMATRQHHLIDVASGALVACAVVLVFARWRTSKASPVA
jgi:membrane-associated phospholipid phosphatase